MHSKGYRKLFNCLKKKCSTTKNISSSGGYAKSQQTVHYTTIKMD